MKALLLSSLCFMGQMVTLHDKPVVHLKPHESQIKTSFGGKTLELIDSPTLVLLPKYPPERDTLGEPWRVEVKNMGPRAVTIQGKNAFTIQLSVGKAARISSNGEGYSLKH